MKKFLVLLLFTCYVLLLVGIFAENILPDGEFDDLNFNRLILLIFYQVQWQLDSEFQICDFRWDCPTGEDELNCGQCDFERIPVAGQMIIHL